MNTFGFLLTSRIRYIQIFLQEFNWVVHFLRSLDFIYVLCVQDVGCLIT